MSLSFAVIVFLEWRCGYTIRCLLPRRGGCDVQKKAHVTSVCPPHAQQEWRPASWLSLGSDAGMASMQRSDSAWTMDKVYNIYMKFLSIALLQKRKRKKDTGVSTRYSYINSFCICCSIPRTCLNLTMLFNVLFTYSHQFSFSFFTSTFLFFF